ncbi:uncharacterized protein LOC143493605 [Brachyhypopomus gauderio]|uniref:uncharacterized protein LOC143493605 n=1 Tax=Brachyhypopomus gauderio TaxID=698409 RepID=UPI0040434B7E
MAVDVHNIPGMERVDELAEYLVELRTQTSLTLTNQQTTTIVSLWQNLNQFDKNRLVYAARHQDRLLTGRFRSPKKKAVFTPGVESTKRCVLGSSGSPAQWPDCCRLIESIFIRLANIHRSPKTLGKVSVSRWALMLEDYRKIRQLVLNNGTVMEQTTLQLVEVNQKTLMQWYKERLKSQEVSVLLQGVRLPDARPVAAQPLLPANVQPDEPPQYPHQVHIYHMPPNTAGQAKTKFRKILPSATPPLAPSQRHQDTSIQPPVASMESGSQASLRMIQPRPSPVLMMLPAGPAVSVMPQVLLPSSVPQPATPTERHYKRTVPYNTCRKCGQSRKTATGHSQYKGKIFCPMTETLTKEQWLEKMRKL